MTNEILDNTNLPKSLLVLGNGFDLSCNLPSTYKEFLKYILDNKVDNDDNSLFNYVKEGIELYLNKLYYETDSPEKVSQKLGNKYLFIQDLNLWYIIFLYKNMIHNSEWFLIEDQIADELLNDKYSLNIVKRIADVILSIYSPNNRRQYRYPKYKFSGNNSLQFKFYQLLAYCLINKDLQKLSSKSRAVFKELRDKVTSFIEEYNEIYEGIHFKASREEMFEKKILSELIPLIAEALLTELNEVELDFKDYLEESIKERGDEYLENAELYTRNILAPIMSDRGYNEIQPFNILSFNYTTPWEKKSNDIFQKLYDSINVHGMISNDEGIIFGMDDGKLETSQEEFIFSKVSRTLELYTKSNHISTFNDILVPSINNIIFYGHSLSIADFGYFRLIFDKYIDNDEVNFYFTYIVYTGTTEEKQRSQLIKGISRIFGEYSIVRENSTDVLKHLIQNKRIRIINLKK